MASNNKWIEVCDEIDDGGLDDGLDEIARAINSRRDVVLRRKTRRMSLSLAVKDRVMLTNGIKPRYLEGLTAHIREIREGFAVVKLDDLPSHRGRPSAEGPKKTILVPLVHIQKLEEDVDTLASIDEEEFIGDDQDEDDDD